MDRLSMLEKMVQARPEDPFPHYGLAMEHKRLGNLESAVAAFDTLMQRFPNYVPAYLMYGQMLRDGGNGARAIEIFDQGMGVAKAVGDHHAWDELRAAREELEAS